MGQVTCAGCGSVYELSYSKTIMRDQDSIECEVCGKEIHRWSEAKIWTARLIERGQRKEEEKKMSDVIWGDVTNVVDGDTFDITVTHHGKTNTTKYNAQERIRIAEIDAPELGTAAGARAKATVERALNGKHVRCEIQARDTYHRLVCKVAIAQKD